MKKLIALGITLFLLTSLVGCKHKEKTKEESTGTKMIKVANLINGNLGDKSFFDSANAGLSKLVADKRISLENMEMGSSKEDQTKWEKNLEDVSASGEYDLIICGTYQMQDYLDKVASKYPQQKYLIYDAQVKRPNVISLEFKQNDLGYLMGVLAASLTTDTSFAGINKDDVIGFIGGADVDVVNDFLYGYLEGALSVDDNIRVDTRYVTNFHDIAVAKEIVRAMIKDNGVDIIWGVAGKASEGIPEAMSELNSGYYLGIDSDQETTLAPNLAERTLTSGLKNISKALIWIFDEMKSGKDFYGKDIHLGINEGGVSLVMDKNFAKLPNNVQEQVKKAIGDIESGKVKVSSVLNLEVKKGEVNPLVKLRDSLQP